MTAPELPGDLDGRPFVIADARAARLSRADLRRDRVHRIRFRVYTHPSLPDSLQLRCDAAALVLPAYAAFSHQTAAELYALPVAPVAEVHVLVPAERTVPHLTGVVGHEGLRDGDVADLDGRRVVTPVRLFLDLAALLRHADLVVLGDAIVARGLATTAELAAAAEAAVRKRGVRRARRAIGELDPRSASPMESRLRTLLTNAGLPPALVNADVRDDGGIWLARADLVYPTHRVVEYEGDQHRTDQRQWRADVLRGERLREAGWTMIRVTADDVFANPDRTVSRVLRALNAPGRCPSDSR